jgi:hypothetical protein
MAAASELRERATRQARAGEAVSEDACRGVRGQSLSDNYGSFTPIVKLRPGSRSELLIFV